MLAWKAFQKGESDDSSASPSSPCPYLNVVHRQDGHRGSVHRRVLPEDIPSRELAERKHNSTVTGKIMYLVVRPSITRWALKLRRALMQGLWLGKLSSQRLYERMTMTKTQDC